MREATTRMRVIWGEGLNNLHGLKTRFSHARRLCAFSPRLELVALFPINPVCCSAGCNDHRLAEQAGNQNISFCLDLQIVVLLLVKAKVISKSMFHPTLRFWTYLTWNLFAASIRLCLCVNKNDCIDYLQQRSSAQWYRCKLGCSCSQNLPGSNYRRIICSCSYYMEHAKILL